MCGIIGFNSDNKGLVRDMARLIDYRGPDSKGFFSDSYASLGAVRLSIVDREKGSQPIFNEDSSLILVFNGEIYNYRKLFSMLKKKRHEFSTETDGEILLHLYEDFGTDFLSYVDGMFAFAIYDLKRRRIVLARDRFGIKPLYYYFKGEDFAFSSDIKPLLFFIKEKEKDYVSYVRDNINRDAIFSLLRFRYNNLSETLIKDIFKLENGSFMVYDVLNKKLSNGSFFDVRFDEKERSYPSALNEFDEVFKDTMKDVSNCDVSKGIFLSSGVDSALSAFYAKHAILKNESDSESLVTYTAGFENNESLVDERDDARKVSELLGLEHKEVEVPEDSIFDQRKLVWFMSEPTGDSTVVPMYYLSREAKKRSKVVIVGDGSDEIFYGYEEFKILKKARPLMYVPKAMRGFASLGFKKSKDGFFNRIGSFVSDIGDDSIKDYHNLSDVFTKNEIKDAIGGVSSSFKKGYGFKNRNYFKSISKEMISSWLSNDILLKTDSMTMANSIEGRLPFLSTRISDFAFSLKDEYKISDKSKRIVNDLAVKKMGNFFRGKKKMRFYMPLDLWKKSLVSEFDKTLSKRNSFIDMMNKNYLLKLRDYDRLSSYKVFMKKGNSFSIYYPRQMFSIITLSHWFDSFVERDDFKKPLKRDQS